MCETFESSYDEEERMNVTEVGCVCEPFTGSYDNDEDDFEPEPDEDWG